MSDHNPPSLPETSTLPAEPSSAMSRSTLSRRRVVKGAMLSLPAVMTLKSGAALAQSSALRCVGNINELDRPADNLIAGTGEVGGLAVSNGEYVRELVQSRSYVHTTTTEVIEVFVDDHPGALWQYADTNSLNPDRAGLTVTAVDGTFQNTTSDVAAMDDYFEGQDFALSGAETQLAAVVVDQNGNITGLVDPNDGVNIMGSCYASFTPV